MIRLGGTQRFGAMLALAAMLSACGDGGSGSGAATAAAPTPTPTPTPVASTGCTLRARQDFVLAQLKEWYLFPETLPTNTDPTPYATVSDYLDYLTATARSQRRDRYFTYLTSIKAEDAYYASGASAGFGFRLSLDPANRLYSAETFENTPALAAGIDRGTEIVAIGTTTGNLQTVSSIVAASGTQGLTDALGPNTAGTARVLQIRDAAAGTRTVTLAKADYDLTPVSSRYGAKIIDDNGTKVGYVNLRTFISTADPALRDAFAQFKAAGVTQIVFDLRYNGGGLVSIAELASDLMGAARSTSQVVEYMTFRSEKSAQNNTRLFQPQPQSIAPTRIAFIGTGGTASASELTINAQIPYLHANVALVGTNTYGKPVGQIALDNTACDDRLRAIAFSTQNADRNGYYYDGLAGTVEASCKANDDIAYQLGDPREASTRAALDFVEGKSCTPIGAASASASAGARSGTAATSLRSIDGDARKLLTPDHPRRLPRANS